MWVGLGMAGRRFGCRLGLGRVRLFGKDFRGERQLAGNRAHGRFGSGNQKMSVRLLGKCWQGTGCVRVGLYPSSAVHDALWEETLAVVVGLGSAV